MTLFFSVLFFFIAVTTPALSQSNITIDVDDVMNTTTGGGSSSINIGTAAGHCRANTNINIRGEVRAQSTGSKTETQIGTACGKNNVSIGGNVINNGGKQAIQGMTGIGGDTYTASNSRLHVGNAGRTTFVAGDVKMRGSGTLDIGGACAGRLDGRCCIHFHIGTCVLDAVPPNPKYGCPPRYTPTGALCRLYYRFGSHQVEQ